MKKWLLIALLTVWWMPLKGNATVDVQRLIDEAEPGSVITIPSGQYSGQFLIDKPLTIKGDGTLVASNQNPVLTIQQTNDVHLEGVTIKTNGTALQIKESKNISLQDVRLENVNVGLQVHDSDSIQVNHVKITGREGHYSQKGNGLAFYKSHDIQVTGSTIDRVQDGIYLEEVDGITLQNNTISNGRYGIHFMYSENGLTTGNHMEKNITGFMVMMAKNIEMTENTVTQQQGLNSNGIVLYDVKSLHLHDNVISENRTAISIQNSKEIMIEENHFQMNETAVEVTKSDNSNSVVRNTFTGNILTARSDQTGINLAGNYYDDYRGMDANDDGMGDTAYVALSSFGQWMVREPAYQYFVESPAVTVLATVDQQINRSSQDLLSDESPMIMTKGISSDEQQGIQFWQLSVGLLILLASGYCWRRGVRI